MAELATIGVENMRVCQVCGVENPIGEFKLLKARWRTRVCKKCYYSQHRDDFIKDSREYYRQHKDDILTKLRRDYLSAERRGILTNRAREYYARNTESLIEQSKRYYVNHRSDVLLKLRRDNLSTERREILENRGKGYYAERRNSNIEIYGTACTPEFTTKVREQQRQKRALNKQTIGYAYPADIREKRRLHYLELRKQALQYYGDECECCGEARYEMLTFDHKVKIYYKDKVRGVALTYDAIKTYQEYGYPNEQYRILCWNCNMSKGHYGYCPHRMPVEYSYKGKAIKLEVIQAYGGKCVMCGDNHWEFMTIDHINGNGNKHRKLVGNGMRFYKMLKREGWPQQEYRLLCGNCNCNKGGTD